MKKRERRKPAAARPPAPPPSAPPPRAGRGWAAMFDAFATGMAITTPELVVVRANRSLCAMLNKTPQEIEGQPCYRLIHGLEQPPPYCVGKAALASGQVAEFIAEEPHLAGRFLRLFSNPFSGKTGEVAGLVHRFRDVTAKRVRLRNLEALYRLTRVLSRLLDQDQVLGAALEEALSLSGIRTATIVLFDELGQPYRSVTRHQRQPEAAAGPLLPASAFPREVIDRVFVRQQPAVLENPADLPQPLRDNAWCQGNINHVVIPMVARGRVAGLLLLGQEKSAQYQPRLAFFEAFAQSVAIAAENARSFSVTDATLRQRIKELETIREAIRVTSNLLDLDAILKEATRLSALALDVERCAVMLLSEDRRTLKLEQFHSPLFGPPLTPGGTVEVGPDHIYYQPLTELRALAVEDLWDEKRWPQFREARRVGLKSTLAVPLAVSGKAIGTLNFGMLTRPKSFSPEEISLAQAIAGHLAVIIENARLHRKALEGQATLEAVLQSMDEGLVLVDPKGAVVYSNRAAEGLLGLPPEWHRGKNIRAYIRGFWDRLQDAAAVAENWEKAISHTGDKPSLSLAIVTGCLRRDLQVTLFPVGSPPPGNHLGTGILLRDVTTEKEVDRMKTEFISLASHELRTPMTAILGFSELLLRRDIPPKEQQKSLEYILQESQRLTSLLDDILNISNIEAGRLSLQIEPIPVRQLLEQVASQFKVDAHSHPFTLHVSRALPPVLADRGKLAEVLHNLVDNAVKYSPGGGPVSLSAYLRTPLPNMGPAVIVFAVKDQGLGIPEAELPNLFTRFHRVKHPETRKVRGTGLGLYIVRTLVDLMGGRLWAESRPGKGSAFYVSLPAAGGRG